MAVVKRLRGLVLTCLGGLLCLAATATAAPGPGIAPVVEVVAFGVEAGSSLNDSVEQSPLFAATDQVGLPEELAIQLSELFAEDINFHRDLVKGYVCTLVYEMYYPDGMPKSGRILAARFITPDKRLEAFLFPLANGEPGYFDERGVDINKTLRLVDPAQEPGFRPFQNTDVTSAFRQSPLDFTRVTSLPSVLRYHPILKEWRAHRGTDYGAPIGTKVRATSDGVVTFLGERGGYGKLLELRHFDRYTTRYGHLNAFAPGLRVGDRVGKSQVIGEVGMTGLATGPHLHYELHADKGATRPDKLVFAVRGIPSERHAAFQARVVDYRRKFAFANRASLIRLK